MSEALRIALGAGAREGFEILGLLLLLWSALRAAERPDLERPMLSGTATGLLAGGLVGFFLLSAPERGPGRAWAFAGLSFHGVLFFSSVFFLGRPALFGRRARPLIFLLSALLVLFEAGGLAWVFRGILESADSPPAVLAAGLAGLLLPCLLFPLLRGPLARIDWTAFWTPAAIVLSLGTFRLMTGGVPEFAGEDLMISIQRGIGPWLSDMIRHLRDILLIAEHPYLPQPAEGLMRYLGGDRVAMSLMLVAVFFPPVWILARLAAAPDPEVRRIEVGARRRMVLAQFRQDIFFRGIPMMLSFVVVVFLVHSANLTLNPLYDPAPVVVTADEGAEELTIPLADDQGDFRDGKVRRYLYFYGDRKIVFLALMKPDGSVAAALDECEICRPAAWNTKAIGYAQRGKHLVCKYCVTPIPVSTFGQPGGCNPIPLKSSFDEQNLYIAVQDLVETWNWAQKLEKAGTHF